MQNEEMRVSTDDDMVRIIMDVYRISEQEALRALREATSTKSMTDF